MTAQYIQVVLALPELYPNLFFSGSFLIRTVNTPRGFTRVAWCDILARTKLLQGYTWHSQVNYTEFGCLYIQTLNLHMKGHGHYSEYGP